nr:penicillin-binding transpeptidase domain-containing protein [bacterium]
PGICIRFLPDQVGLGGIEYRFQERLEGAPERVIVPVDSSRNILAENDYIKQANVRGADVILTIDAWIQHTVEQEILDLVDRSQAAQAMAVVMKPKTGEILAMAAVPSFDPNDYQRYGEFRRKCRPVTDMFEPGSVIKPFIVAGALEAGVVTPDQVFDCERGNYAVRSGNGRVLKIIHDDIHRFDRLSVRDIVVRSSNIGTCKIAAQLGATGVSDILRRFGFGSVSGVELPGETAGILRSPDSKGWSALSMFSIPYGQEMATNCLVITTAYSILANRGLRVQPHIVKGYCNPADGRISPRESRPPERIIAPEIAEQILEMLIGVTEDPEGTGYRYCRIPGFRVAGKTGTAQKAGPAGTYAKGKRIASWAGFFPAYDPKVVIFLMVDEPTIGKYGGELAGSSFARIANSLIRYWGLLPDQIEPWISAISQKIESKAEQEVVNATEIVHPKTAPEPVHCGVMPNLIGLSAKEAYLQLIEAGFRARFEGEGRVLHQEISAGEIPSAFHAGQVVLGSDPSEMKPTEVLASVPDAGKPGANQGK